MPPPLLDLAFLVRQWLWFLWPAWPLALWTLWRWRRQLGHRHLTVPLVGVGTAVVANLAMAGSDRALMLALPGLAVLAAFALPTLKRSASAAVDWFSMFFFTSCAIAIWVVWASLHTGVPAKPAANVARLAPGFVATFSATAVAIAVAGTVAWLALVRWRTGRHREALWKSLVLPAGGVALCWLLLMTLWLPLLDYARSPRALVERIAAQLPADGCVATVGVPSSTVAAIEVFARRDVRVADDGLAVDCTALLRQADAATPPPSLPGWTYVAEARRPTDRDERTLIYRRVDER